MWGGDCLTFRCYTNLPKNSDEYFMIISTSDFDPSDFAPRELITKENVGQNYILSLDKPNSDFIGNAFLCRSVVINNKVYVKIFSPEPINSYVIETIDITDNKCVYDVIFNITSCNACCDSAKFIFTLTNFDTLPDFLNVDYEILACLQEVKIVSTLIYQNKHDGT